MPWISAGASLLGSLFGSDSASDAQAAQERAAAQDLALRTRMYEEDVKRNEPAIRAGNLGRNKLLELLGLGGTPGGAPAESRETLRARMLPSYTRTTPGTPRVQAPTFGRENGTSDSTNYAEYLRALYAGELEGTPGSTSIDEGGLQAAIEAEMARNGGIDSSSGEYGALMRDFTGADLQNEPGYQFGLSEGNKAIDRRAASGGGYFSGAALKAAQRFGQDYAGTKFNEAFNRDTSNKTNKFNRLQGLIGGGQVAANQQQSSGANFASGAGGVMSGLGNAQGASAIAQGNAWQGAVNGLANAYQDYNARNQVDLMPRDGYRGYRTPTGGNWGYGGEY
jgi:hypothetical protein